MKYLSHFKRFWSVNKFLFSYLTLFSKVCTYMYVMGNSRHRPDLDVNGQIVECQYSK